MQIRPVVKLAIGGLVVAFSHPASAQLAVGPVPYQESVDGVPVTINVLSVITVQAMPDSLAVTAKVDGDLFDLQQKIGAIGDTFNWPNNNCANSGADDRPKSGRVRHKQVSYSARRPSDVGLRRTG